MLKQLQVLEQSRFAPQAPGSGEAGGAAIPAGSQSSLEGSVASVKESVLLERQKRDGQYEELNRQSMEL